MDEDTKGANFSTPSNIASFVMGLRLLYQREGNGYTWKSYRGSGAYSL